MKRMRVESMSLLVKAKFIIAFVVLLRAQRRFSEILNSSGSGMFNGCEKSCCET